MSKSHNVCCIIWWNWNSVSQSIRWVGVCGMLAVRSLRLIWPSITEYAYRCHARSSWMQWYNWTPNFVLCSRYSTILQYNNFTLRKFDILQQQPLRTHTVKLYTRKDGYRQRNVRQFLSAHFGKIIVKQFYVVFCLVHNPMHTYIHSIQPIRKYCLYWPYWQILDYSE